MWPWWVKIPTEDFTDVTLAIGDTFFSVMRRYRTRVSYWLSQSLTLRTELTDVTLVSEDTYWRLYWETLIINDTYYRGDVREIVVLIMEVDKVVDEVTDMEIDM